MDLLDQYKKAWKNQPETKNKISRDEIFKMMHAKSSSIAKWIFIIGLCEFAFFSLGYLFFDIDKIMKIYEDIGLTNFIIISSCIFYLILVYFLYNFYKNYKNISVVENTKSLMNKILKTRKTIKNYVLFNLITLTISSIIVSTAYIFEFKPDLNSHNFVIMILILGLVILILVSLFWLFYRILYGILLKKLHKNYKELAKLDELN